MPDSFIVTVCNTSGTFETDLEIPSRTPLAEMKGYLLEILKLLDGREFYGWHDCAVRYQNRTLSDGETLADAGVRDGCRLFAVQKE